MENRYACAPEHVRFGLEDTLRARLGRTHEGPKE